MQYSTGSNTPTSGTGRRQLSNPPRALIINEVVGIPEQVNKAAVMCPDARLLPFAGRVPRSSRQPSAPAAVFQLEVTVVDRTLRSW